MAERLSHDDGNANGNGVIRVARLQEASALDE
jgi:hypothetical protein